MMIWLVGIGGSLGASLRFSLGNFMNRNAFFPLGTWVVNVTGSFLLGWLANLHLAGHIQDWLWLFAGVGFCGAYTTFSTFGRETITLIQSHQWKSVAVYVIASLLIGGASAALGLFI